MRRDLTARPREFKTRPGDVYDPAALERDLKELLSLNFFDKTATRVLTEEGVHGGVNVIFEVKELPIVRDLPAVLSVEAAIGVAA